MFDQYNLILYSTRASLTSTHGQINVSWLDCTILAIYFSWTFPNIPKCKSCIEDSSFHTQRLDQCKLSWAKYGNVGLGVKKEEDCTRVRQLQFLMGQVGKEVLQGQSNPIHGLARKANLLWLVPAILSFFLFLKAVIGWSLLAVWCSFRLLCSLHIDSENCSWVLALFSWRFSQEHEKIREKNLKAPPQKNIRQVQTIEL